MAITIYNTLSRKKEPFQPLEENKVKMYVCGPTVYGFTHLGNARPSVVFDMVRRYLKYSGYDVLYVSNFTDVDDKIINRARDEKVSSEVISEKYTEAYLQDMDSLSILRPDVAPKVTEHIPQIVKFIEGLVANGSAYATEDGEVLFSVRKFEGYGKLSGKKIDELQSGARVSPTDKKKDPLDFSLWKPQKAEDEPAWDSPWGKGRPGWHIECSVMSGEYLGETFDIHGGGIDLIHPHHENEIAQSEGLTKKTFVRYWMHNAHLTMDSEKMSKSLGNIFLNREFIERHTAETLKYLLLSSHYRSPIDFSDKIIRDAQCSLHRYYTARKNVEKLFEKGASGGAPVVAEENKLRELQDNFVKQWRAALDDDFNSAKVMGFVFDYVRAINAYLGRKKFKPSPNTETLLKGFVSQMKELAGVLNLYGEDPAAFLAALRKLVLKERNIQVAFIEEKIAARKQARVDKDFQLADSIRDELLSKGIELQDTPDSTEWDVSFN